MRATAQGAQPVARARSAGPRGESRHGHNDRGLALANALAAVGCGVGRVHGTALGIGERCGNTAMEHLVVNLADSGAHGPVESEALNRYCELASEALGAVDHGAAVRASRASVQPPDEWSEEAPVDRREDEPLVPLRLSVNGDVVRAAVPPSRTLLELLRYDLDLVGTKQGCDKGDCGAWRPRWQKLRALSAARTTGAWERSAAIFASTRAAATSTRRRSSARRSASASSTTGRRATSWAAASDVSRQRRTTPPRRRSRSTRRSVSSALQASASSPRAPSSPPTVRRTRCVARTRWSSSCAYRAHHEASPGAAPTRSSAGAR